MMRKTLTTLAAVTLAGTSAAALAQDWKAAVAAGTVGEQSDGYLGAISGSAAAMVSDVNIKRKAAYTAQAAAEGTTVEAAGISGGCTQIKRLGAGQKYRGADGGWHTVGQGALDLDPRCPR